MLKFLRLTTVVPIAALIYVYTASITAHAEDTARVEDSPCFMTISSGKAIDLSNLCGPQSVKTKFTKGVFQVPIKRRNHGVPIIDVTFNGTQTFEMYFDTGAAGISLTPQVAESVGFAPNGTKEMITASDRVTVITGHVASVEVAGLVINNPEVDIIKAPDLGLLGEGFFQNYDITVREKVIEFRVRQAGVAE